MNPEQAWQSVLGQLQMEMPRASFDTWVRDTKPVSYQDGVLTIDVCNAYVRDWLESRVASTVNRLLVRLLKASASANFAVEKMSSTNTFSEVSENPKEQLHEIYHQIEQADIPLGLAIVLHGPVPIWKQVDIDLPRWQQQVMEAISWDEE